MNGAMEKLHKQENHYCIRLAQWLPTSCHDPIKFRRVRKRVMEEHQENFLSF
jgi:hypothetical protein